jgi:hypothetical protein
MQLAKKAELLLRDRDVEQRCAIFERDRRQHTRDLKPLAARAHLQIDGAPRL